MQYSLFKVSGLSSVPTEFADYRSSTAASNLDSVAVSGEYTNFDFDDEATTDVSKNQSKLRKLWKWLRLATMCIILLYTTQETSRNLTQMRI
jgi:hypothetical protein